jgi:syntaxin-binding protein 1
LATLNEYPLIRFHDPNGDNSSLSAKLASHLKREMLNLKQFDRDFPRPTPYDYNGPSTVIIVDRAIDLISPLIHTLSYQCLVEDLFDVSETALQGIKRRM